MSDQRTRTGSSREHSGDTRSAGPLRVLMVCSGNICRSPLAHRLLERQAAERGMAGALEVESAGTDSYHVGEEADRRMRATARRHGWTLSHRSRRLSPQDLRYYHLIFAMDHGHLRVLQSLERRHSGETGARILLFRSRDPNVQSGKRGDHHAPDVPDPYYGGEDGFEEVYQISDRTCSVILDEIAAGYLP